MMRGRPSGRAAVAAAVRGRRRPRASTSHRRRPRQEAEARGDDVGQAGTGEQRGGAAVVEHVRELVLLHRRVQRHDRCPGLQGRRRARRRTRAEFSSSSATRSPGATPRSERGRRRGGVAHASTSAYVAAVSPTTRRPLPAPAPPRARAARGSASRPRSAWLALAPLSGDERAHLRDRAEVRGRRTPTRRCRSRTRPR